MTQYVALLRGINVGGKNILPMQDFRDLLTGLACTDVATYIQSGNAVFRHAKGTAALAETISSAIEEQFGFRPPVTLLRASEFSSIAAANPYVSQAAEPKSLHVWFLMEKARQPNMARMDEIASGDEKYTLAGSAFYLHAPNGIGRSKLAAEVEKCLGVQATARNWRTVCKIGEMLAIGC